MIRLRPGDGLFPALLRAIFDPPPALYLRGSGDPTLLADRAVAVVGARSCSPYGAQVARTLGRELAAAGLVVVSGLARGVDGEAHRGALEAGGLTVDQEARYAHESCQLATSGQLRAKRPDRDRAGRFLRMAGGAARAGPETNGGGDCPTAPSRSWRRPPPEQRRRQASPARARRGRGFPRFSC